MMPFALDLTSTFVIGSTLPVATTDTTMVPLSTVAKGRRLVRSLPGSGHDLPDAGKADEDDGK